MRDFLCLQAPTPSVHVSLCYGGQCFSAQVQLSPMLLRPMLLWSVFLRFEPNVVIHFIIKNLKLMIITYNCKNDYNYQKIVSTIMCVITIKITKIERGGKGKGRLLGFHKEEGGFNPPSFYGRDRLWPIPFWPIHFWPSWFWIWCVSWWGPKGCWAKPRKKWDPEVMGPRRVGPRRVGPAGWGPEGWGAQHRSLSLSLCVFSWYFGGVWKCRGRQMFTFGVLKLLCEGPGV